MIKSFIIKALLLSPIISVSQDLIINTLNRNVTTLNGTWNYIVDPYETGYYNYRYQPYDQLPEKNNSAFFNNYHAKDKLELVEYNFDKSPTLTVPGDWNSQNDKLFYYEGTIWYKRSFDYSLSDKNNRLYLYFGAINYKAEVYLNGTKLGTHEGGFTPFNFEVTSVIKEKDNYLVVKVDNTRFKEAIPTINTDWWNYGGITRDVKIIEEPSTFIKDYSIQLKKDKNKIINGYIKLDDSKSNENVTLSIPELHINKLLKTDASGNVQFEISSNKINFWSPESPKLYDVYIKTDYQTLKDEIGFRTIETKGPDILLNGKSIFLKGICIHEENAMRGARAYNDADALVALNWAKELGCNYVRLAHYPHNEHIIKLADKMGLMVWEEIPVYWTVDFTNNNSLNNAKNQLSEAITRDKNRAAIIIWSMANETPPSGPRNTFLKSLISHTKSMDTTRLISAALEKHNIDGVNILDDEIGNYLDIVAFNQYTGWYGGSLEEAPNAKWDIKFNKPVVISEFGGGALQGLYGTIKERWTEEYQEYLYQQNLKMIEKIPNIRGTSPWILNDFRSPKRVLPDIQDGWNRKGLISNHGIKKKAFYIMQDFYKKIKKKYE
ncbi:glycoside hydrolase family 2 protein [Changchengzhania lutea]|uniref:glycoside hydrolase family 2 protein n=1 Tax=Changchengzhania lutea TaxID=2049305 RepID=UPI00115DAF83|nr:glycoside hydrolase family 2 TIM barrel-domain containing protein [Changchengzhania lutea]